GASGDLDVGRRTIGNAPTFGTLDLGASTSVAISVDNLRIGTAISTGGFPPQPVQGALTLSQAGSNTIHATTLVAGDSAWTDNTMATSTIHLGATNEVRADSVTIGGRHSNAAADILAGGTCDLAGRSGAKADLFIGENITDSGGIAVGLFDLTGGELDATLRELVLGRHGSGLGGGQGTLIVEDGDVTADSIDMGWPHFTGLSLAPQNSVGTLTIRGGDFAVGGDVTTHSGLGVLNLHGGSLTVGGDIATVASGPTGPGTMTITLDGGLLDLTGGSMDLGPASPPSFSFTGGTLKDVGGFDDTLNQGILVMGMPQGDGVLAPGGSIGGTSIAGDYNLVSGSLEIEIQSPGSTGGTDYDQVELTAPASTASLDGTLEVVLLGGYLPAYETTFDVVTANSVLLGPRFVLDESGAPMPAGRYFDASVAGLAGGQALRLTVLPEPATLALLALGALVVIRRRKRNP
ncbi:MAG: PEP-CTERM sorting domain-containing protein, partial [Phycisphaerae bacterium]